MKRFIFLSMLMIGLFASLPSTSSGSVSPPGQTCFVIDHQTTAPAVMAQETGGVVETADPVVAPADTGGNFFSNNWIALVLGLMGFIELIVRLTPTEQDNSIFNWLAMLINALLPNLKKGGGTFKVSSN